MKIETKYIAEDGTEFDTSYACLDYEDKSKQESRKALKDYILFYGTYGGPMIYSPRFAPTYVYLKKIPSREEAIFPIWDEVLQEELIEAIEANENKCGWYICDKDDKWYHLSEMQNKLKKIESTIQSIVKNQNEDF